MDTNMKFFLLVASVIVVSVLLSVALVWVVRRWGTTMQGTQDVEGLYVVALAAMISIMVFTVFAIDHPFDG